MVELIRGLLRRGEFSPKVEITLEAEWERQAQKYISLNYHKELGLSKQEYRDSLPKFSPQPEAYRDRFDIPVIVETRISPKRQCELAGIKYYLWGLPVSNWPDHPKGYKTPNTPYVAWMQNGNKNKGKSVEKARKELAKYERGATVFDGLALYISHPEILNNHYVYLPGTKVGSEHAARLGLWSGRPGLDDGWVGYADPGWGSASCGR